MSSYAESGEHRISLRPGQLGIFAAKLAVTGLCFWYLARHIDVGEFLRAAHTLDLRWTVLAIILLMAQIPLVGLRWCSIVDALGGDRDRIWRGPMIAITAMSNFFAQVLPNIAADSIRVWMLTQLGRGWRLAIVSVMIDRAIGIAALIAIGFVVLLFPSALTALGGYRVTIMEIFGAMLVAGGAGLALAPPLSLVLERWRYTMWIGRLAKAAHTVLLGRPASIIITTIALGIHLLTIIAVWLLAQASGLALPVPDAAVLFVIIVAVALIPVSVGGWGVRELAVTSLLGSHGVSFSQALFFSVCFGLVLLIAALPGALVWAVYSPSRLRHYAAASDR
jgi:hypothetical protein